MSQNEQEPKINVDKVSVSAEKHEDDEDSNMAQTNEAQCETNTINANEIIALEGDGVSEGKTNEINECKASEIDENVVVLDDDDDDEDGKFKIWCT